MEFTKKITIDEQKKLSSDDQRDYLRFLFEQEGNVEELKAMEDSEFVIPAGGTDQADNPGALPNPEQRPLAATQTESNDHSDLPPSVRGELGGLEEVTLTPEEEVAATEEAGADPTAPAIPEEVDAPAETPYLHVNDHTTYNTQEEAIKGIDEKDRTIQNRDEELRLARQENDLLLREKESYRIRMESEAAQPPQTQEAPASEPHLQEVEAPPSSDELYAVWDDEEKGPLEAMKLMMPHAIQDLGLTNLIELAARLKTLKADEYLENLQKMGTEGIIQNFQEEYIYGNVDEQFPEFEGKWRNPDDPIGRAYQQKFHEIDKSYIDRVGAPLSEIAERSPESVQWVIEEVLSRMDVPSNSGENSEAPATTEAPVTPKLPTHTDGAEQGEPERRLTREEAEAMATKSATLAVNAVNERNKLHGQVQTEGAGAKPTQPATAQKVWSKEAIKRDPTGWAKARRSDPTFSKATLDMLPQERG